MHWDGPFAVQVAAEPVMVTVYCAVLPSPWVPAVANPITEMLERLVT